jgi:hypothetical protein
MDSSAAGVVAHDAAHDVAYDAAHDVSPCRKQHVVDTEQKIHLDLERSPPDVPLRRARASALRVAPR